MSGGDRWRRANWSLLVLALLLTGFGIAAIASASEGLRSDWAWMQVRWVVVGLAGCLLVLATPYRRIVQARWALYAGGVALLVLVLFKGTGQSAGRWIGVGAFRMQPSEFMKVILVVALAGMLRYERRHYRLKGLVGPLAVTMLPVALVMKQPDLGTALLLVPLLFAVLYAAGARVRHLGVVAGMGLVAGLAMFFIAGILHDYQKDRILAYITEHTDSEAAALLRQSQGHQLHRGLVAAGLGGFSGVSQEEGGVASAVRDIPERHSDFVFPVFAARFGFLGVTMLLALYLLFLDVQGGGQREDRDGREDGEEDRGLHRGSRADSGILGPLAAPVGPPGGPGDRGTRLPVIAPRTSSVRTRRAGRPPRRGPARSPGRS